MLHWHLKSGYKSKLWDYFWSTISGKMTEVSAEMNKLKIDFQLFVCSPKYCDRFWDRFINNCNFGRCVFICQNPLQFKPEAKLHVYEDISQLLHCKNHILIQVLLSTWWNVQTKYLLAWTRKFLRYCKQLPTTFMMQVDLEQRDVFFSVGWHFVMLITYLFIAFIGLFTCLIVCCKWKY